MTTWPLSLMLSLAAPADDTTMALAVQAVHAFQAGTEHLADPGRARQSFREAAQAMEQLRQQGVRHPALERALGNAWYLAGNLPRAILAYRRGLSLTPDDRAAHRNLAYVREQVRYPDGGTLGRPPIDHRPPWLPRLNSPLGGASILAAVTVGSVALTRWRMTRRGPLRAVAALAWLAASLLTLGWLADAWQQGRDLETPPVVLATATPLRWGNGLAYPPKVATELPAGTEARLLHRRGHWLLIELSGGEVGWVPATAALVADDLADPARASPAP
ncbi:MAG: hypothetical protein NZ700_09485 [Gemmataceae bacterium]|nr:hypothetical protein [Gemmataceae bacterium]MDW8264256.1 hypothetical protein [Gemmataceae bacterium]